MVGRSDLECLGEVRLGALDIERKRPLAGEGETPDRSRLELLCVSTVTGGARELQRRQVMVGEDVSQILRALARLLLDPGSGCPMAAGSSGARDLPVADVPHQHVPEGELVLALHRARASRANELLARELVQRLLDLVGLAPSHLHEGAGPEDLAQHGRVLEQALAVQAQGVEAGGDQRLHRVRHLLGLRRCTAVREQAHELLSVERVSACTLEQRLLRVGGEDGPLEQACDEAGCVLVGQRGQG